MKSILLIVFVTLMSVACTCDEQVAPAAPGESADSGIIAGSEHGFLVKLTSSMSAEGNEPGDTVTGMLIDPWSLRGGLVEGTITKADRSFLNFHFHTLEFGGKTYPIESKVTAVVSSKGVAGQDDLGQRVRVAGDIIAYGTTTAIDEGAEIYMVAWDKGEDPARNRR
ncbi:MAG: hypothetical protein PVF46_02420 [Lysobacterales bacterium]|jgi:hypothetical protein